MNLDTIVNNPTPIKPETVIKVVHDTITIPADTIVKVIHDTVFVAQSASNIEPYQKIIETQAATYNIILSVFVGLVALFAGATWFYNKKIAKAEMVKEVNKIFLSEKMSFLEGQKLEFKKEIYLQKGESSRLFAIVNASIIENTKNESEKINAFVNIMHWWRETFLNYFLAGGNQYGERIVVDQIKIYLTKIVDEKIETKFFQLYEKTYNYQLLYDDLQYINESLTVEKMQIFDMLNHIAKENNKEFQPMDDEAEDNEHDKPVLAD